MAFGLVERVRGLKLALKNKCHVYLDFANIGFSGIFNDICSVSILINVPWFDNDKCRLFWAILNSASSHIVGFSMLPGSTVQVDVKKFVKVTPY